MRPLRASATILLFVICLGRAQSAETLTPAAWKERHDQLVERLKSLVNKEDAYGPAYEPLYHAAIPWYELWGGRDQKPVDPDMVSPEDYATELAAALERGGNYFAENPDALFPLVFRKTLPNGKDAAANYLLSLPAGFPSPGRTFPLIIDLHGSGWLGHKISFKRRNGRTDPTFGVTPINMGGPWQIDFLNAYLDELLAILPIDRDRIFVQGHSLGAMATWEWAMDNPERFAAISPRAGVGEPYRAVRLKYVPSWVIHGENDEVIPSGFAEQMVTALQAQGSGVRLSIISGGEHNMPPDLDQGQVVEWYLRQTRSHAVPPADPRDTLGISSEGFSPWGFYRVPETRSWKSQPLDLSTPQAFRDAAAALFRKAHARGELVDAPLVRQYDAATHMTTLWLAVPKRLQHDSAVDASVAIRPASSAVRFYFKGDLSRALDHIESIRREVEAQGHKLTGTVWITSLSMWWQVTPDGIAECRPEIE